MKISSSIENEMKKQQEIAKILIKNGWKVSKTKDVPKDAIEIFSISQEECENDKCSKKNMVLYKTNKDIISIHDARKKLQINNEQHTYNKIITSKKPKKYKLKQLEEKKKR